MWVRVLHGVRGPNLDLKPDQVVELEEITGSLLIGAGSVELVGAPKRRRRPAVETATAEPGQKRGQP